MENKKLSPAECVSRDILIYLRAAAIGEENAKSEGKIRDFLIQELQKTPECDRAYKQADIGKNAAFRAKIQNLRLSVGNFFAETIEVLDRELICANTKGYFLVKNTAELLKFQKKLQKTAESMLLIVELIEKLKIIEKQKIFKQNYAASIS